MYYQINRSSILDILEVSQLWMNQHQATGHGGSIYPRAADHLLFQSLSEAATLSPPSTRNRIYLPVGCVISDSRGSLLYWICKPPWYMIALSKRSLLTIWPSSGYRKSYIGGEEGSEQCQPSFSSMSWQKSIFVGCMKPTWNKAVSSIFIIIIKSQL